MLPYNNGGGAGAALLRDGTMLTKFAFESLGALIEEVFVIPTGCLLSTLPQDHIIHQGRRLALSYGGMVVSHLSRHTCRHTFTT